MVHYQHENFSLENKLVGDIIKERPEASEVIKKYFGEGYLESSCFRIKTLELACLLFGVDQYQLIQEIEKGQN